MKKQDLKGKEFGRLTAKEYSDGKWLCECSCGNKKRVLTNALTSGRVKSCGCLVRDFNKKSSKKRIRDLSGLKIDLITVKKLYSTNPVIWLCDCDCGNKNIKFKAKNLLSGQKKNKKSCGCINRKRMPGLSEFGTNIPSISSDTLSSRNKSGTKGVCFDKSRNKWAAEIMFQGKKHHLGRFAKKEDAIKMREDAEKELFGNFLEWYEGYKKSNK